MDGEKGGGGGRRSADKHYGYMLFRAGNARGALARVFAGRYVCIAAHRTGHRGAGARAGG